MKYLNQIILILGITIVAEAICSILPVNIPSSILGLFILIILLFSKIITVEDIAEVSEFLISIMPVLFVPATFALVGNWQQFKVLLPFILLIVILTTVFSMGISGKITDYLIERRKSDE